MAATDISSTPFLIFTSCMFRKLNSQDSAMTMMTCFGPGCSWPIMTVGLLPSFSHNSRSALDASEEGAECELWLSRARGTHFRADDFVCLCVKSLQSCPTLCDLMDCSLPGSSVHGILQTRILEWVAVPSSGGSSCPRDQTQVSCISWVGRWVSYH